MTFADLLTQYGAVGVFFGAAFEGETAAFLGGVLAHRQLIVYWQVALAAACGSFFADQVLFLAGRYASRLAVVRRFTSAPAMSRVTSWLETYPNAFIFAFRFIYGIRTISPVAIGLSNVSNKRFLAINLLAAICWGISITAVGYVFGSAVEQILGRLRLHQHLLVAIGFGLAAVIVLALIVRRKMRPVEG